MKNKKVKVFLIIVSIILIVQSSYLSYSYLKSKKSFDSTVNITVGYIDITNIDSDWIYSSSGIDVNNERGNEVLTNTTISADGKLRPGDSYYKNVTIKNSGDLATNIRITPSISTDLLAFEDNQVPTNKLFILKITNVNTSNVTPAPAISTNNGIYEINNVPPNGEISFDIAFEINKDYVEVNGTQDKIFSNKSFNIVIDAVQTNGPFPNN